MHTSGVFSFPSTHVLTLMCLVLFLGAPHSALALEDSEAFSRRWVHSAETSALIYWQLNQINKSALSYVEYGTTPSYGSRSATTSAPRLAQLHSIRGLERNQTYHYRMVIIEEGIETHSENLRFSTADIANAIRIPADVSGPTYDLNQAGRTYVLTQDISTPKGAFIVSGSNITLELDGHTVTFGTKNTANDNQFFGIHATADGPVTVRNGHVLQGADRNPDYSSCVETRYNTNPREFFGIFTDVRSPNSYPMRSFGGGAHLRIHHNYLYSRVTQIEDRHYPGNDLLLLKVAEEGDVKVHDNILTGGTHKGINASGGGSETTPGVEVSYNDIEHHARYVNGYAIVCALAGIDVHHNKVTSIGRGTHLLSPNIKFHDNYLDTRGHATIDTPSLQELRIELHGIKFEGTSVKNTRVYNNYMRITQTLPDANWDYVPATPLNVAGNSPNARNEIFDNIFVALTHYSSSSMGGYGNSGEWAAPLYFVSMTRGSANAGSYSAYIHDNQFFTNDYFVGAGSIPDMTIRIEDNSFKLVDNPVPTSNRQDYKRISQGMINSIAANNTFGQAEAAPSMPPKSSSPLPPEPFDSAPGAPQNLRLQLK